MREKERKKRVVGGRVCFMKSNRRKKKMLLGEWNAKRFAFSFAILLHWDSGGGRSKVGLDLSDVRGNCTSNVCRPVVSISHSCVCRDQNHCSEFFFVSKHCHFYHSFIIQSFSTKPVVILVQALHERTLWKCSLFCRRRRPILNMQVIEKGDGCFFF